MKIEKGYMVKLVKLDLSKPGNSANMGKMLGYNMRVLTGSDGEEDPRVELDDNTGFNYWYYISELELVPSASGIPNQSKDEIWSICEELKTTYIPDDWREALDYILDRVQEIQEILD